MIQMSVLKELRTVIKGKKDSNLTPIYDDMHEVCAKGSRDDVVMAMSAAFFAILEAKPRILAELITNPIISTYDILWFTAKITNNFLAMDDRFYEGYDNNSAAFHKLLSACKDLFNGKRASSGKEVDEGCKFWQTVPFCDDNVLIRMRDVLIENEVWQVVRDGLYQEDPQLLSDLDQRLQKILYRPESPLLPSVSPTETDSPQNFYIPRHSMSLTPS